MHHPSTFIINYDENISDCKIDQTFVNMLLAYLNILVVHSH